MFSEEREPQCILKSYSHAVEHIPRLSTLYVPLGQCSNKIGLFAICSARNSELFHYYLNITTYPAICTRLDSGNPHKPKAYWLYVYMSYMWSPAQNSRAYFLFCHIKTVLLSRVDFIQLCEIAIRGVHNPISTRRNNLVLPLLQLYIKCNK